LQKNNLSATFFIATGYLNGGIMWNDQVIEAIRRQELDTLDLTHYGLHCFDISTPEKKSAVAQQVLQKIKHLPTQKRQTIADFIADQVKTIPSHLMMTDEQLIKLHQAGMEIGGHTVTHPILANLDEDMARQEICQNKQTLERLLKYKLLLFAYPNGKPGQDYQPEQIELLKALDYQAAVSTQWGVARKQSDFFQLPRFTPWDQNVVKFMGRMAWMYKKGD
jgi:peptidoglycan/xylan/chitin deacetylase (PgdA/CDA1 family)